MSCPTTITPAPIPGINDMRAVTAHGLADAATLLKQWREVAEDHPWARCCPPDLSAHDRALAAVQRAAKLLTDRDEVLADAVQSARLQADMIEQLKAQLARAHDALAEISLAGMAGTGQESPEAMRDWHARRAWEFIGIAARARLPEPTPAAAPERAEPVAPTCETRGLLGATSGVGRECDLWIGGACTSLVPCQHQQPVKPCRTCGPDGCPDSCSCPKGGAA